MRVLTVLWVTAIALVSCDGVLKFGTPQRATQLTQARILRENGDLQGALKMVNRDISKRGETVENLRLRVFINLDLQMNREAEADLYSTFSLSTQDYYESGKALSLFTSAFCIATLGDQDRAKGLLRLLHLRHPEVPNISTEKQISELTQLWYDQGLKKLPRDHEGSPEWRGSKGSNQQKR